MDTLTFRQERFVMEYLKDQNASAAAARAGYQAKNRAAQGHELLNNPDIRDRVRFEMSALLAEIRCSAVELIKQRRNAAFFDPRKMFAEGGEPLAPVEMDEETRSAVEVKTVNRKSGPVVWVRQADRQRALRALEKVHERLEKLDEAYYAALEKAGKVPTLEEIEGMDAVVGEEEAAAEIAEKCRVLSGGAGEPGFQISEKCRVLSGSGFGPAGTRPSTGSGRTGMGGGTATDVAAPGSEKHHDLSGLGEPDPIPIPILSFPLKGQGLAKGAPAVNGEKYRVLSGSKTPGATRDRPRLSPLMAALVRAAGARLLAIGRC